MPTRSRRVLRLLWLSVSLTSMLTAASADDKPPANQQPPEKTETTEYCRPALVALSWEPRSSVKVREIQPAWRPDGERLDADEAGWLYKETRLFEQRAWGSGRQQQPLHFVFRVDERCTSPQRLRAVVIANGKRFDQTASNESGPTFLSTSAVTMPTTQLTNWPAEVDVEVRVPVAEPEMIKRIETLPAEPIQIDRGVRWYFDPEGGASFRKYGVRGIPLPGITAFVLQVNQAESDPLVEFTYQYKLQNQSPVSAGFFVQERDLRTDVKQIAYGDPSIKSVEFYKQRFRIDRYERVRLRNDLAVD